MGGYGIEDIMGKRKDAGRKGLVAASGVYRAYMVVMFISCKMR